MWGFLAADDASVEEKFGRDWRKSYPRPVATAYLIVKVARATCDVLVERQATVLRQHR